MLDLTDNEKQLLEEGQVVSKTTPDGVFEVSLIGQNNGSPIYSETLVEPSEAYLAALEAERLRQEQLEAERLAARQELEAIKAKLEEGSATYMELQKYVANTREIS